MNFVKNVVVIKIVVQNINHSLYAGKLNLLEEVLKF